MALPKAYQSKNVEKEPLFSFEKSNAADIKNDDLIKKNEKHVFLNTKFFLGLGLLIFLYAGLRILQSIDRYQEHPIVMEKIKRDTLDQLKQIKTNYAYASEEPPKPKEDQKPTVNNNTDQKETVNNNEEKSENIDESEENAETNEFDTVFFDPLNITSPNDVKVLKALGIRRQELDQREKALGQKELELTILGKKVEEKVRALEIIESKIKQELKELDQRDVEKAKSLAKIYSSMKPKEAAVIFEGLDMSIMLAVIAHMSERKIAPIIALLTPDRARDLTKNLSHKSTGLSSMKENVPQQ